MRTRTIPPRANAAWIEDERARLQRAGDVWLEHQRAFEAEKRQRAYEASGRHDRNAAVAELWAKAIFAVACIAAVVWVVQVVSR